MRAFIIRPFGTKNDIDFDEVDRKLIDPALNHFDIKGRTTMEILRQGNIRLDMFQRLLTADIVIADISIPNANVYYELGVRHALRGKHTFLIRARGANIKSEDVPFDLKTDRYLSYDAANPAASLATIVEALSQTLNSEEHDSPVFQMLPDLVEQERARFIPVPRNFREEVERAKAARHVGDLELMADELQGFEWESEGLRVIGRALFSLGAHKAGCAIWEQVRGLDPLDFEANSMLGTIYQRLKDLTRADQALNRVLTRKGLTEKERAEVHALLGRNAKSQWRAEWDGAPDERRQALALSSSYLHDSVEAYDTGFIEDLNHFYSGLNALALLRVTQELARACPEVWEARFDTDAQSRYESETVTERIQKLSAAVALAIRSENERLKRLGKKDVWVELSEADLCFLTSTRPARVAAAYREAIGGAPPFVIDSARSQILIYQKLGLMTENVNAALSALGEAAAVPGSASQPMAVKPGRILLFTGHMIDAPNRPEPRFPADKEPVARQAIKEAVKRELAQPGGIAYGIAGGASGGDILFHEVCEELGVETILFLAMNPDEYVQHSVQAAGPQWVERFRRLCESHKPRVLSEPEQKKEQKDYIPRWLLGKPDYGIWQRNALWMLHNGLAAGEGRDGQITLIALWDGKAGDGPGGTADLVEKATQRGAKTIILNTTALFARVAEGQRDPTVIASIVRPFFETPTQTKLADSGTQEEHAKPVEVIKEKAPAEEPEAFDVFLSYNRSDEIAVQELAKQLKALGVKPWLDIWQLRPGLPWQDELEKQLASIKSAAVFVGKDGIGPWQDMEQDALLRLFTKRQCPVIPVILPEAGTEPKLPLFLTGMTWVDFRSKQTDPMTRLIWGITGKRPEREDE